MQADVSPEPRATGSADTEATESAGEPSVSIVIPTYQRRESVCQTVRSLDVLKYEGRIEVVIVVDGSTDGTAEALNRLDAAFPVQVIQQPNAGAGAARNRGAAAATGDILLFLDDDMIVTPDLIAEHARSYRDGADAVIGRLILDAESRPGFLTDNFAASLASAPVAESLTPFDIWTARLSVRRKVFEELGGFDENFTGPSAFALEDAEFGVRLLARFNVRYNPLAVARIRYLVTPRAHMERTPRAVAGHLLFIRKHPVLTTQLMERSGWSKPLARFVYRPLSQVPFLPRILSRIAVQLAENSGPSWVVARVFSVSREIVYWAAVREKGGIPNSNRLLILCYHAIGDRSDDPILSQFAVRRELLEAQLDSLTRRAFTFVSPDALAAFIAGAPLPRRAVLLTFDDCYAELPVIAREVLQPRQIRAMAFAVTGMSSNEWDQKRGATRLSLLSSGQLRDLQPLGVEIGCHSRTHRDLRLLSNDERMTETAGAAQDLLEAGLPRPRFFAYPYGACDAAAKQAVRQAGYVAALGLSQRHVRRSSDPFDLPRVMILPKDHGWRFLLRTAFPLLFAHLRRRFSGI
jgi:glycosyltransferase involved in cell wall biosynthesis/peptidoglycan/xylan/chitin deacetylase (PgdA/CDA1 family)